MTERLEPPEPSPALVEGASLERRLPSGRSVVMRVEGGGEAVEIRSFKGDVEVRIVLTDAGPVVSLRGARLEVESPEIAFRCRTFDVEASERVSLDSKGRMSLTADEARIATARDIDLNGAFIRLNCSPEVSSEEAVAQALAMAAQALAPTLSPAPPESDDPPPDPGCAHDR